ncbi:MAG TPA: SdrD B-like domain-containing protein, partial [Methanomicrobiales archaeon]|nr:SdrD B-like domain-containing protein [Methanomicrobiales archaeon]
MKISKWLTIIGLVIAMGILAAPVAAAANVAGTVYNDWDGTHGTVKYLGGVTVSLMDSTGTTLVASTTSGASNGRFAFMGVAAGNYLITVQPSSGWTTTSPTNSPNPNGAEITVTTGNLVTGTNVWVVANTLATVSPTSITETINPRDKHTETLLVTAGQEGLTNLKCGDDGSEGSNFLIVTTIPQRALAAGGSGTIACTIQAGRIDPGTYSFNLVVVEGSYDLGKD